MNSFHHVKKRHYITEDLLIFGINKFVSPLWDKKGYIAYKMVTSAPKRLLGLQDKSEKLIARIKRNIP